MRRILSLVLTSTIMTTALLLSISTVMADDTQSVNNDNMVTETTFKDTIERRGVQIIEKNGHMFFKGENTTTTKKSDGTIVYHPNIIKGYNYIYGEMDVDEDYIVIDGAKYSTDKKTLLAIPFNEKKFAVREGTKALKMSAIMYYGAYEYGGIDIEDSGDCHVILEALTLPKSLKKVIFDDESVLEWGEEVAVKKLTLKGGKLSASTLERLLRNFYKLKEKNVEVPKKYGKVKNGMLIYKNALIKYYGKAKKITVPKNVTQIADYAFTHFDFVGDPDADMEFKFKGCPKLKTVVLSKKVKNIGSYAFLNCKKLKKVIIPKKSKLKKVSKNAFTNTKIKYKKFKKKLK
ncbi:MAG: hypothetical protein E7254_03500 [Lachnospiraceae bacterium]|nr:hypothetical protein [Lachnospiraceae bacterium]